MTDWQDTRIEENKIKGIKGHLNYSLCLGRPWNAEGNYETMIWFTADGDIAVEHDPMNVKGYRLTRDDLKTIANWCEFQVEHKTKQTEVKQ